MYLVAMGIHIQIHLGTLDPGRGWGRPDSLVLTA